MQRKSDTQHGTEASSLARAQEHGSQLLRAAHDAANNIDRAVRYDDEVRGGGSLRVDARPEVRVATLRAYSHAQDARVLAARMLAAIAGADPHVAMLNDATNAAADFAGFPPLERAEFARDVAQHVVAALTAGDAVDVPKAPSDIPAANLASRKGH